MRKVAIISSVVLLLAVAVGPAMALPLKVIPEPHAGTVVHLNLGPVITGPTNPLVIQPFTDGLNSAPADWHWETETYNSGGTQISFLCGWFGVGGFTRFYQITLGPGASFYTHFSLKDLPETGPHVYVMDNPSVTSSWHDTIQEHQSTQPDVAQIVLDGSWGEYTELSGLEPEDCDMLRVIPEPATICLLALGGVALLRRRK